MAVNSELKNIYTCVSCKFVVRRKRTENPPTRCPMCNTATLVFDKRNVYDNKKTQKGKKISDNGGKSDQGIRPSRLFGGRPETATSAT